MLSDILIGKTIIMQFPDILYPAFYMKNITGSFLETIINRHKSFGQKKSEPQE